MKTVKTIISYIVGAVIILGAIMAIFTIGDKYPIVYVICPIVILVVSLNMRNPKNMREMFDDSGNDDKTDWIYDPAYSTMPGNIYHDDKKD